MNESYRLGEQSIIAHLQRLANGTSTAELDVAALPTELRSIGEQLQKTLAVLQQERQLLERSAYVDSLTNLGNRGGLDRHVDQLWLKGTPFTCAYIDIDHLKHCNDKFGHAEGNRYILGICRALTEAMEHDEMLFRIGGDEFVLVSPTTGEAELEQRLERTRTDLVEATSDGKAPMIASFSFGCSHVDPLAGDTRRQMTMDADRKMYRYKLMHRVQQPKEDNAPMRPIADQLPCNDRVFQAISMSSETRYPFILNLDTGESQWSVNAVRDFGLPSQHPYNSLDMWLARVHPEDRDNVHAELDMVINGTWHFHYMQYRVMDATGAYVLCDCTGYRLDGTDTEPNMYVGMIINRSPADTTDSVTGLGDVHALVNAIGEMRRVPREAGFIAIKIDDIAEVNARFGFDAGDRVLAESAACLTDCSRGKGRLFRSTGPTFVALFDDLDPEETNAIAEEIERFLGSPVLIGSLEYQPPIRVATLHLDAVDRQPVSILNELKALLKEAPQVPGTKLD
ncbi:diguanylate cyclase domain-containing protein [Collinsella aerofaciens]|uniref:Diguanylate cyclase n=1 Tax=Collinsella aerofaciens TaxID=74426 RepID=A0A6L8RKA4_9ACTN|nr:diguanylate cyclase [Collinsella aerofaciens]MZJ67835.1 diguanylate cyclase [Collinsella aerofaciens]MZJ85335.1 diguanylate cyclase [Collinsella aerofaciens]